MEGDNVGVFIKSKLSNLIAYLQETLASDDPQLVKGFESMKTDLEAAPLDMVVGITFKGIQYIAPHGFLPPDNEQSIAWLRKFTTLIKVSLQNMIPDKEKRAGVEGIFDKLEDIHFERFILYINCFSEVLQPEAYANGVKLHEK